MLPFKAITTISGFTQSLLIIKLIIRSALIHSYPEIYSESGVILIYPTKQNTTEHLLLQGDYSSSPDHLLTMAGNLTDFTLNYYPAVANAKDASSLPTPRRKSTDSSSSAFSSVSSLKAMVQRCRLQESLLSPKKPKASTSTTRAVTMEARATYFALR
ncbi:conserved hypothetical protein [Coccidioides posadasii str. Silveira]|uniref:Uncharacterized protein n=1 Tax=Coccidioides posadasii (strain RMSCC 757 / Silveira) TaxID=443226 RepID=E9D8A5_COCPS|nr:conserved hypothetical protein [Coccidioides posadasii str. Silveira]